MDIRDKQTILKKAFDSNGTYAENDTLLLRYARPSDKEAYSDIYRAKPEWGKLFQMAPQDVADSLWDGFLDTDTLNVIIVRKNDNKVCGYCGLQLYAVQEEPELSIELVEECRHQGIGTIALPMLMKRFSEISGAHTFISKVRSENIASLGLMRKLGGILQGSENELGLIANAEHLLKSLDTDQLKEFRDMLSDFIAQYKDPIHVFRFVV